MATGIKRLAPNWRTLLSALLIVLAFPPWNLSYLIWFCLVPWFAALQRAQSRKGAIKEGFWLGYLMSLGGFYWIAYVLVEFARLPWAVGLLGLALFGLIGQPQFVLFALIQQGVQKQKPALYLALSAALAYAGLDWVLPKLFVDTLGHAFYDSPWVRQAADLGGATLLTFLVFFVNLTLWQLIHALKSRTEPSAWPAIRSSAPTFATALLLVLSTLVYGKFRSQQVQGVMNQDHPKIQMGVIQANIGDFDKVAAEQGVRGAAYKIIQTFMGMSDQALTMSPKPDALVWPETSYPSTFRTPETTDEFARDQWLERFVRERGTPLLFGGYDHRDGKDFNAFFFLAPTPSNTGLSGEGDLQIYRKNILLLFGEYIPGANHFRFLKDAFPQVGHFGRGTGPEILMIKTQNPRVGSVPVGPVICYEVLFPNYIIETVRKGSRMILNITNDSWFGPWGEPHLHLALTTFRSVEARVPQLRATNTGISALVMPDGTIAKSTGLFRPEIFNVSVPLLENPIPTLMLKWGDWFGPVAFMAGFGVILGAWGYRLPRFSRAREAAVTARQETVN